MTSKFNIGDKVFVVSKITSTRLNKERNFWYVSGPHELTKITIDDNISYEYDGFSTWTGDGVFVDAESALLYWIEQVNLEEDNDDLPSSKFNMLRIKNALMNLIVRKK